MKNTQQHTPNISISDDVFVQVFFNNILLYMYIYIHTLNEKYVISNEKVPLSSKSSVDKSVPNEPTLGYSTGLKHVFNAVFENERIMCAVWPL